MIICPKCQTHINDPQQTCCPNCGEKVMMGPPDHSYPTGRLMLIELIGVLLFLWAIYLYVNDISMAAIFGIIALFVMITGPVWCRDIHRTRQERYEEYVKRVVIKNIENDSDKKSSYTKVIKYPESGYRKDLLTLSDNLKKEDKNISYDENATLEGLVKNFRNYCEACGFDISLGDVQKLFIEMANSRLLFMQVLPEENTGCLFELLRKFFAFGCRSTNIDESWKTEYDLLGQGGEVTGATGILLDIYTARYYERNVCFTVLNRVNKKTMRTYFDTFMRYVRDPMGKHYVTLKRGDDNADIDFITNYEFCLPNNMWYFCIPTREDGTVESSTDEGTVKVIPVDRPTMRLRVEKKTGIINYSACPTPPVSFDRFSLVVSEAYESYLLAEDIWKKWDSLKEFLTDKMDMKINNRDEIALEKLSSLYMMIVSDGAESNALDFALNSHLLSRIKNDCDINKLGNIGICRFLDNTFGENVLKSFSESLRTVGFSQ